MDLNNAPDPLPSKIRKTITSALLKSGKDCCCIEIKQILIQYLIKNVKDGWNINSPLGEGKDAIRLLEIAIRNDDIEFVEFLLSKKANSADLDLSFFDTLSSKKKMLLKRHVHFSDHIQIIRLMNGRLLLIYRSFSIYVSRETQ